MKTIKQACTPRPNIFDVNRRDTVLSLTNLVRDEIPPEEFFEENHLTQGMRLLLENGFKRLEGKSDIGVYRLTQAMGGGKTHNLIAFGLLARYPEWRQRVMGDFYSPSKLGSVSVVAFSGRESDAPLGVWGAIAGQLGKKEFFKDYYSPLSAPGRTAWVNLLQDGPLIILLDEMPPYLENARSRQIGNTDLSVVTGTALANLLVAVMDDLPQVCVVITDLTVTYASGSQQINDALANLQQEIGRSAMNLEPVRMNSDEFYHILRKRIFAQLPSDEAIEEAAQAYAKAVRGASNYLIPRNLHEDDAVRRDLWRNLSPEERFYIKALEVESHGENRQGVYQEFARGFGLKEYTHLLQSGKANETRLKAASEFKGRELGKGEFGRSLVRNLLFGIYKVRDTEKTQDGLTWLRHEAPGDYWAQRQSIASLLRYFSRLPMHHWQADAEAARLLAGAVENDAV